MYSRTPSATLPTQFTGQAGEYFGIWIVNIFLTLITLGLYSPWAKIRQKRYFYGSTHIAGASFDYVADSWAILKGRLIAVALVVGIGIIARFVACVEGLAWLAFLFALPWLIVRTRRFNALNTVYRNLRFNFNADYGQAFVSFVLGPFLLLPLSLGLAQPWVKRQQMRLVVDNSAYGNTAFHLEASLREFLSIFKRGVLGTILGFVLFGVTFILLMPNSAQAAGETDKMANKLLAGMMLLMVLWILGLSVYLHVLTNNLVYGKTILGGIPSIANCVFGLCWPYMRPIFWASPCPLGY